MEGREGKRGGREGGFILTGGVYRAFLIVSIASLTFLSPSPLMI